MATGPNLGKVHVITGPGKGKTTAAFGLAMRAAGHGIKVCIVQFLKTGETSGEVLAARKIPEIEVHQFGTGTFVSQKEIAEADRACAHDALSLAARLLSQGGCGLLVLDEVNVAASFGLIGEDEVLSMLQGRAPGMEVVLTGRNAPEKFIQYADYVSYIESKKHPYRQGDDARKGIEW